MKQVLAILCVLAAIAAIAACDLGGGGANGSTTISGTITVADAAYWPNIRIGVFSDADYPDIWRDENGLGSESYRITYWDQNDDSDVVLIPVVDSGVATVAGTTQSFSFELPATPPPFGEYYFLAAWYDADLDGNLDVADSTDDLVIVTKEFNRIAARTFDDDGTTVTGRLMSLYESLFGEGYGYTVYDDASTMNYLEDLTTATDGGFKFNIADDAGTW